MSKYALDLEKYAALAREAAAEGCVLLKNDNKTLPLRKGDKVAVFGRIAFDYYKSGLGSGGLVNTRYVVGILDALREHEEIVLDENLLAVYENWIKENPFDHGSGWGKVPWSQVEMQVTDAVIEAAKDNDVAVVAIGRTAGEDQDTKVAAGSYLLTDVEKELIEKVSKAFERVVIVLNVGNIIDMSWVETYNPAAVMYVWQGGQEGGHGVVDVLTGTLNPCGKLTDTIAKDVADYPSTANFGDLKRNFYTEDIYVGYRYFETFAKDKVLYPFGFGLSYTTFETTGKIVEVAEDATVIEAIVKNVGTVAGKEVVQVYMEAPQGLLGKPARALVGFGKTGVVKAGESESLTIEIPTAYMASYDDGGMTGNRSCYVLEAGTYNFYVGSDVRVASFAGNYEEEELVVVETLAEASAPVLAFERMKPLLNTDGSYTLTTEPVPTRTIDPNDRLLAKRHADIPYTGNQGYKLGDVFDNKVSMNDFVAQLSDDDLIHMFRGEGMCSPKATPGTAAAFGGITDSLANLGIPVACCADGPSGIRMDCGTKAFSLPNGTSLGCTFNYALVEELYHMLGLELRKNKIDTLLGPGMNLHRNPLNGRNFEYISEDPVLTGKMSAAQLAGMGHGGVCGTVKHFCGNNQEAGRRFSDSVISERALRETYLKGFEIAIKEGGTSAVMTTYGAVNGLWTAGSFDLCTTILREEWGFDGIVMTDWWAEANIEGEDSTKENKASMVAAQNDLYMCVMNSASNPENDNVQRKLASGDITRGDLQRNAANILTFIMKSPVMLHALNRISQEELDEMRAKEDNDFSVEELVYYTPGENENEIVIDGSAFNTERGNSEVFGITVSKFGSYELTMTMKSDLGELAQLPVSIFYDNALKTAITIKGSEGAWVTETRELGEVFGLNHYIKLYFGASGLVIDKMVIKFVKSFVMPF